MVDASNAKVNKELEAAIRYALGEEGA